MESKNFMDTTVKKKEPVANYPIIMSSKSGRLKVSRELERQINYMHAKVGSSEWSGVLVYEIVKGDFDNPAKIEIDCKGLYPMDIGTPGYTEYDFDENNVFDMHDYYPQIIEKNWRQGHIHSHHSMRTFFSGTDEQELRDNTPAHAYYLSLIVNFDKTYTARLCVMAEREVKGESNIGFKNIIGKDKHSSVKLSSKEKVVYAINMDIELELDSFHAEFTKLEKRIEDKKIKVEEERRKSYFHGNSPAWIHPDHRDDSYQRQLNLFDPDELNNKTRTIKDDFNDEVEDFLYKLISTDAKAKKGHLQSKIIVTDRSWIQASDVDKKTYCSDIEKGFNDFYHAVFIDPDMNNFNMVMDAAIQILDDYSSSYEFASDLIDILSDYSVDVEEKESLTNPITKGYGGYPY